MIGNLLYESLTIRLMFEINQKNLKRKVTKDDELIRCLLNEEKFDMAQVLDLLNDLGLDANKPRIAVYLVSDAEEFDAQDVVRLKMGPDSREIIYSLLNERCLLIYKDIPEKYKETKEIKSYILRYIRQLQEMIAAGEVYKETGIPMGVIYLAPIVGYGLALLRFIVQALGKKSR